MGPSGSGKSTLLRCVNRLEKLTSGEIWIDEDCLTAYHADIRRIREEVGMVFQSFNLFPHLSALGNVTVGPRIVKKTPQNEAEEVGRALLDRVGLGDKYNSYPDQLSGGQQQRLCIARTIAVNPEVILMDEPCSALDPIATARIEELIDELRENYCIVIVTHSMQQAARVSQLTAFFHLGTLVEVGDTEAMFTNPQERRTQDYIMGRFG